MTRKRIWPIYDGGAFKNKKFERQIIRWAHQCPGCHCIHRLELNQMRSDEESTVGAVAFRSDRIQRLGSSSKIVRDVCHYYIKCGFISYLQTSPATTHALAGTAVQLPEWAPADLLPKPRVSWWRSLRHAYPIRCLESFVNRYVWNRKVFQFPPDRI